MSRNNMNYEICITSRQGGKWFKDTVRRLSQDYKTGNIQLDQLAHKSYVCYDENHGHQSPQTAYTKDLKKLLEDIRSDLRKYNSEGLMIGEGFSDLTASFCDGFWNWNQMDNPHVVRYSVPWMLFSNEIDALDFGEANYSFANGLLFDLKIEGGVGILSDFPGFQNHLKALSKIKEELVDSFATGDFEDEDGLIVTGSKYVTTKIYLNPITKKGCVIVANTENKTAQINIEIKREIRNIERITFDGRRVKMQGKLRVRLKPYEVNGIEFDI